MTKVYEVQFVETRMHTVRVYAKNKVEAEAKGQEVFDERDYDAAYETTVGPSDYGVKSVKISKDQVSDVDVDATIGEED